MLRSLLNKSLLRSTLLLPAKLALPTLIKPRLKPQTMLKQPFPIKTFNTGTFTNLHLLNTSTLSYGFAKKYNRDHDYDYFEEDDFYKKYY